MEIPGKRQDIALSVEGSLGISSDVLLAINSFKIRHGHFYDAS